MLPHSRPTVIYIIHKLVKFQILSISTDFKNCNQWVHFFSHFFLVFIPINPLHAVGTFIHQDRSNSTPIICFLTVNCLKELLFSINPLRAESFQLQF